MRPYALRPGDRLPRLLIPWTPWYREFFANLRDQVWPKAMPALELTSQPADFWPDVFINRRLPFAPIRQSVLAHIFVILAVWGITENYLLHRPLETRSPFRHAKITYYPLSEYLPPIDTGGAPAPLELKGVPEYAKQPIISAPKVPDNSRQTIVTPPRLKIEHDLPLPNIVAWNTPTPEIPLDAVRGAKLTVPPDLASVVPPPANAGDRKLKLADMLPTPVAPPPDATRALPGPKLPGIEAVAPAPDLSGHDMHAPAVPVAGAVPPPPGDLSTRKLGNINIGEMTPSALAPKLPVTEQASVPVRVPAARGGNGSGWQQPESAAPAPGAIGDGSTGAVGKMIALSIHPALPDKPVDVQGNRRGVFAATPEGKPGAPSLPEIKGAPGGTGTGIGTGSGKPNAAAPEGIYVGPAPADMQPIVMAGPPAPAVNAAQPNALLAMARTRSVADLARDTLPPAHSDPPKLQEEQKVFGVKRSYAMTINMPNLTSAGGGSWIMRFAELHDSGDKSELSAPVADRKVDPAYPQDAIRERIQGTVMLYAIIRADGSVNGVRVLRSVDRRLDENARIALTKWHFFPGTKHGVPVDVEAVVQIPFSMALYPSY
jgi:TonB family protein